MENEIAAIGTVIHLRIKTTNGLYDFENFIVDFARFYTAVGPRQTKTIVLNATFRKFGNTGLIVVNRNADHVAKELFDFCVLAEIATDATVITSGKYEDPAHHARTIWYSQVERTAFGTEIVLTRSS